MYCIGPPGIEPGLHPPHGRVLPAYSGPPSSHYSALMLESLAHGPLAQLVERVIRIDEASGSNPLGSTPP